MPADPNGPWYDEGIAAVRLLAQSMEPFTDEDVFGAIENPSFEHAPSNTRTKFIFEVVNEARTLEWIRRVGVTRSTQRKSAWMRIWIGTGNA